jgi:hypothetical protein
VNGNPVTANADLDVIPDSVNALDPRVTITGAGFPAGANVNCWFTRPDGRVQATNNQNTDSVYTAKVGSDGTFALSVVAGNSTYYNNVLGLVSSEEPGVWAATCATPDQSALATYEFTIYGLATDP